MQIISKTLLVIYVAGELYYNQTWNLVISTSILITYDILFETMPHIFDILVNGIEGFYTP